MSIARMLAGMALFLFAGTSIFGQATYATVKQPNADVRSGPSDAPLHYATNRLRQGERVEVVGKEENGWLPIKPPSGSVSWINKRFLRQLGRNTWSVESEADVQVLYGSEVRKEMPIAISARLQRGALVESVGEAYIPPDGGIWLPIKPPPSEVRYI